MDGAQFFEIHPYNKVILVVATGAAIDVGMGKLTEEDILKLFEKPEPNNKFYCAPPEG